jgi:FlaA1/EpsC-like NDP-sugar epimerase
VSQDLLRNRYPLLLTDLDTEGEKSCETFAGPDEQVVECGMSSILAVRYRSIPHATLSEFVGRLDGFISSADTAVDKDMILEAVAQVVPEFHHVQGARKLDQRM